MRRMQYFSYWFLLEQIRQQYRRREEGGYRISDWFLIENNKETIKEERGRRIQDF